MAPLTFQGQFRTRRACRHARPATRHPPLLAATLAQLTNILRDVGEDRVRQRIYLPQEDLRKFGVTEQSLLKGVKDDKYVALMKFQIARARYWYKVAEDGIPMLSEDARLPVRASLDMYSTILDKIEANNYDNFNKRAYTSKFEKLMIVFTKSVFNVRKLK